MMNNFQSLQLLDSYVQIPTISSQITPEIVAQVQTFWHNLGLEFEQLWPQTPGSGNIRNPALFCEIPADVLDAHSLLLYGHWDVQPTGDVNQWVWHGQPCPPFQPTYFLDTNYLGSSPTEIQSKIDPQNLAQLLMVARGAADNKGQHLANILGVLGAKQAGTLQWNIKILLDGEEEVGSPNLRAIVHNHRHKLTADFMVGSDGPKSDNFPTLLLGVRGLLALTVRCQNGSGRMLHSGNYGNITPNPTLPLAHLLDDMEAAVVEMGQTSTAFRDEVDSFFGKVSPDRARFEPFLYPTFNINSLMTEGATGGQRRTIIPSWVEASVDVRLIPGLHPQEVYQRLASIVEKANRSQVGLSFVIAQGSATAASYTSPQREGYAWLKQVVDNFWGEGTRLIPILGGTLPNDIFTEDLSLASYWLPAANSHNRQHDTNEHFILEHFFRQQEFYQVLASTPNQK